MIFDDIPTQSDCYEFVKHADAEPEELRALLERMCLKGCAEQERLSSELLKNFKPFPKTVTDPVFFKLNGGKGGDGFGEGTFKALFLSMEQEKGAASVLSEVR